jgi:hypothetical protein
MRFKGLLLMAALLASTLIIISPTAATPENKFYLSPANQSGHVGGTVSFNVMIDSFTNLNAYQFGLRWDQSVLRFKSITFVWLSTQGITDNNYVVSIVGNELTAAEWFMDPTKGVTAADKVFATITWDIVAGGETSITFIEARYWQPGGNEVACTSQDGSFYTEEPFVDFFWTPSRPRINELVTFNASPCFSPEGLALSYQWYIDGADAGTGQTATATFSAYSKTPHNITLVVADTEGDSFKLQKNLLINRDLAIFSIWPSPEDYMGSIIWEIPAGKYVVVMVRIANIGTITEYTDNSTGDFPSTTALNLYLVHSDGTEELLGSKKGKALRRYRYAENATFWYYKFDWDPLVGVYQWFFWDTWGLAPETGVYLKANLTVLDGDTDPSNNVLTFGPLNITEHFQRDIRIEGIWTYDDVGYVQPYPPFPGTTFKFFYGPYTPGTIANITVGLSNVGDYNEMVTYHVYAGSWDNEIWSETVILHAGEYNEFTFPWNTTGYYGTYTLWVTVDPIEGTAVGDFNYDGSVDSSDLGMMGAAWGSFEGDTNWNPICDLNLDGTIDSSDLGALGAHWGEFGVTPTRWAVWDNNIYEMYATYGIMFPMAYDDWGIYASFP